MSETPECLVMFSVRGAAVSACFFLFPVRGAARGDSVSGATDTARLPHYGLPAQ